jgi:nucleotide-binding universal stress UspA family protein
MIRVPLQTPIETIRRKIAEKPEVRESIDKIAQVSREEKERAGKYADVLAKTDFESVSEAAHDVFQGLISETENRQADMLLMGWQGGFSVGRIYNTPVQRIIGQLKADVGVLKDRGLKDIKSIVLPWGGGLHAWLGLEIGIRIARFLDAELKILRLVKAGVDVEDEREELEKSINELADGFDRVNVVIRESEDVTGGIIREFEENEPDLVIIGASHEWKIRNVLFGTIPDVIADRAPCSVLMVRRYVTEDWKLKASEGIKRVKEQLGLSTSPDTSGEN